MVYLGDMVYYIIGIVILVMILLNPRIIYLRIYYLIKDMVDWFKYERFKFGEYGCSIFVGEQGSGKTIGVVWYLEQLRKKYPKVKILTNFGYVNEDGVFEDWKQLLEVRNGEDGVIFVIDEIQNEYNNRKWKDFPESILSEITQQRKQRIKVILTAQYYIDVVVQLRRQCFEVIECSTRFNKLSRRYTVLKCYKAREYETLMLMKEQGKKIGLNLLFGRKWVNKFVQSDSLRGMYDTYEKVERMRKVEYINRSERGQGVEVVIQS